MVSTNWRAIQRPRPMPLMWRSGITRSNRSKTLGSRLAACGERSTFQSVGHLIERCDFIDMLEESARLHRPLIVELKDGRSFTDEARDVVTESSGEEWAEW